MEVHTSVCEEDRSAEADEELHSDGREKQREQEDQLCRATPPHLPGPEEDEGRDGEQDDDSEEAGRAERVGEIPPVIEERGQRGRCYPELIVDPKALGQEVRHPGEPQRHGRDQPRRDAHDPVRQPP
jgi:hypothetical protein